MRRTASFPRVMSTPAEAWVDLFISTSLLIARCPISERICAPENDLSPRGSFFRGAQVLRPGSGSQHGRLRYDPIRFHFS